VSGKRNKRAITIRVIGISGSPRKGGNTDLLLDDVLEGARAGGSSVRKIYLNDLDFKACQACGGCLRSGRCVVRDDAQKIYKSLHESDVIVLASPIYFGSVTAQVKSMIDRLHCFWVAKHILKKPASAKSRLGYFLCASSDAGTKYFPAARTMARICFNTLNAAYSGEIFCGGLEAMGAVKKNALYRKRAFKLGLAISDGLKPER